MTYYRMAVPDRQTATWIWKTTTLCSLQAVLQLLRSFRALPQSSIRVFTAASKEDLEIEDGPGGDHDIPYCFSLPASMPQLLAWTRLQTRVQAGELEP